MLRNGFVFIVRLLFALFSRVEVGGLDNVPAQGGAILAINHLNILDAPLAYVQLAREDISGLAAKSHKSNSFYRLVVTIVNGIWIDRDGIDTQALREAIQFLQQGGLLGIAPEGTRSKTGALIPAKTGVAYLADKAKVPIVPVAVHGTEKAFAELRRLRRPRLGVRFGEPFTLPPLERSDRSGSLQRNTDEIMCRIAALLPPSYHGVYADHPRLHELLAEEV